MELFENRINSQPLFADWQERKNVMSYTQTSLFEDLTRRFEQMHEWQSVDGLIRLLKEIVLARQEGDPDDRDKLHSLIVRVENRIAEQVKQETDELLEDFEGFSPRSMKKQRDKLLGMVPDAPTQKLRKLFQSVAWKIKDRLDKGSLELAEHYISTIENALKLVEELLSGENKENDLRCMRANLDSVGTALYRIENTPHVKFVGIVTLARKNEISSDTLLTYHKQRFEDANATLTALELAVVEKERTEAVKALEVKRNVHRLKERSLEDQRAGFNRQQIELQIEKIVQGIERRSKIAGQAARQFLEYIKQKDANAAWACLGTIRTHDVAMPPILVDEWRRIAQ